MEIKEESSAKPVAIKRLDLMVGSDLSLVKMVDLVSNGWKNINKISSASRKYAIRSMHWQNQNEESILLATAKGYIRRMSVQSGDIEELCCTMEDDAGYLQGFELLDDGFITAYSNGIVSIWKENIMVASLSTKSLSFLSQHPTNKSKFAVGGQSNLMSLWDISQNLETPFYRARNLPHDNLNLPVPVWDTDAAIVPYNETVLTCTAHRHVRLYDPRSGNRRPVINFTLGDNPFTKVALCATDYEAIVGNSVGITSLIDFRLKGKLVHNFKGAIGSIKDIRCHPSKPIFTICGYDRYLRVFDKNSKEMIHKLYLKSKLTSILPSKNWLAQSDKEDDDGTNIWDSMKKSGVVAGDSDSESENLPMHDQFEIVNNVKIEIGSDTDASYGRKSNGTDNNNSKVTRAVTTKSLVGRRCRMKDGGDILNDTSMQGTDILSSIEIKGEDSFTSDILEVNVDLTTAVDELKSKIIDHVDNFSKANLSCLSQKRRNANGDKDAAHFAKTERNKYKKLWHDATSNVSENKESKRKHKKKLLREKTYGGKACSLKG